MNLTKLKEQNQMIGIAMKGGKVFIEHFLKTSSFLSSKFLNHLEYIRQMLRNLQTATRLMQVIINLE